MNKRSVKRKLLRKTNHNLKLIKLQAFNFTQPNSNYHSNDQTSQKLSLKGLVYLKKRKWCWTRFDAANGVGLLHRGDLSRFQTCLLDDKHHL